MILLSDFCVIFATNLNFLLVWRRGWVIDRKRICKLIEYIDWKS